MQCLWCIIKHEQRKPFLQRLCFFHFLVIIQRLHQAPDMHRILAEQIQRGFICSRTSVLVEPSPGAQSVTSRPGRFFYSITFFRRSIKQQQVLLVDKKQQFVSVFVPPLLWSASMRAASLYTAASDINERWGKEKINTILTKDIWLDKIEVE